jgi:hypothetical protein
MMNICGKKKGRGKGRGKSFKENILLNISLLSLADRYNELEKKLAARDGDKPDSKKGK